MTHHELTPAYPTTKEFLAAGQVAADYLRGGSAHGVACLVKAGWVVAGFAGSFVPDDHQPMFMGPAPGTNEEKAAVIEAAMGATQGNTMHAIDWLSLLRVALDFLAQLLRR